MLQPMFIALVSRASAVLIEVCTFCQFYFLHALLA